MRTSREMRLLTTFVLLTVACSMTGEPQNAGGQQTVVQRGQVHYSATTRVLESFPVQLHTTVDITNRGDERARLDFRNGCKLLLRAYRTAARQQPVWDQGRIVGCTQAIETIELDAGEHRQLTAHSDARQILSDSLPDGHYFLAAYVNASNGAIEIPAGEADLAVPR
jgi:hypothetical protein